MQEPQVTVNCPPVVSVAPRRHERSNDDEDATKAIFVVVIAHPDDESMFFLPTIASIKKKKETGAKLWIVCLTRGNYENLGTIRSLELQRVCEFLEVDELIQADGPEMQDHPSRSWSIPRASDAIRAILRAAFHKAKVPDACAVHLITFDEGGVSGHINHRDCYRSVRYLFSSCASHPFLDCIENVDLWTLETIRNPLFKYLPVVEWLILLRHWFTILISDTSTNTPSSFSAVNPKANSVTLRLSNPTLNWRAMSIHASQFVWYRRLFVIFSCYTFSNRLRRVETHSAYGGDGGREHED
jgi:N-acetylglucosaminylphosphatidylinositol deacetylase